MNTLHLISVNWSKEKIILYHLGLVLLKFIILNTGTVLSTE